MKKMLNVLCIVCMVLILFFTLAMTAFAAEGPPGDVIIPTDFLTWEYLGTMTGVVAVVVLIIQFTKAPLDIIVLKIFGKEARLPTRLVVWILSFIILIVAAYFTGRLTINYIVLSLFNAIIIAWTAMGAYEVTFAKIDANKKIKSG